MSSSKSRDKRRDKYSSAAETTFMFHKGNKGGFGEYTPEGVAKKKLQDKRDEQAVNSASNEPKDCGCC